jgi:hypothetical protein
VASGVAISADGKRAVSGGRDKTVRAPHSSARRMLPVALCALCAVRFVLVW